MKRTLLFKKNSRYLGAMLAFVLIVFTISHSFAQGNRGTPVTITGKVLDNTSGENLVGVAVVVKGTTTGTNTDVNGGFTITAPSDGVLSVTYLGYDNIDVPVGSQKSLTIRLQASNKNLSEVVVIGYGTQKKTSLTASVSTVDPKLLAQKPVVNLTNSLAGRAAGVIATQGSGEPGFDGSAINIRGFGTNGNSSALVIVDGVPRDFSRLDPNTVETISILKDAAAVAPYGVAGANGVILVTTKQGKSGTPTLTYNGYYGVQNPTRIPKFVNSYQYAVLRNMAQANDDPTKPAPYTQTDLDLFQNHTDPNGHPDSQPLREIIQKNRPLTYHNLSLSGGGENIKYFASLGYTRQSAMWKTSYVEKFNGSMNLTAKATKTTTVNLSVNSYVEDQNYPGAGAGGILYLAQRQAPTTPVYYTNGLWAGYIGQSLIGMIEHSGYQFNERPTTFTQFSIDQKLPLKGLSVKLVASYDDSRSLSRSWNTPIPFYTYVPGTKNPEQFATGNQGATKPSLNQSYSQNHAFTYQGILNYQASFGKSDITATGVVESRIRKNLNFGASRQNFNLNLDELSFGSTVPTDLGNSGSSDGYKTLGYMARVNYAYDRKYLLEVVGRYDGSFVFAPGKRFGFFPAVSAGWRLSEEKFIKDNFTWIDNLKLRASYGQVGNTPNGGNYQYLNQYNIISTPNAIIGGVATQGVREVLQGNPNITWEVANKTDIALEASLWNGALSFEAGVFYETRSNLLVSLGASLPSEYGINVGAVNAGIMNNRGFELTVTSANKFSNDLRLDLTGTFSFARNKVVQLFEGTATFNNPNRRQTGRPLNTQYGLQALGYFTADDFVNPNAATPVLKPGIPVPSFGTVKPGDIRYADLSSPNGGAPDGKIDANDNTVIGRSSTPEIQFGFEPRLTYKNFDIDLLFQGATNSNIFLRDIFVQPFLSSGSATEIAFRETWTPQNPNGLYPRISSTPTNNNTQTSSWWLRNSTYIRLKSFEIGYTFSNRILSNKIKSLRMYVAGQNIFTWTPKIKELMDPEQPGANSNYYQQQVFSLGLNASF